MITSAATGVGKRQGHCFSREWVQTVGIETNAILVPYSFTR
jgi:hypothetical protein